MVVSWWLLIAAAVQAALPESAVTPRSPFVVRAGQTARIVQPGIWAWAIPVHRLAYDEYERGVRESDEEAIDHAFTAFDWIRVSHGQLVWIAAVDGEAVQVELLEGRHAGRRGWLKTRHLGPPD
jgi:hypothetical protein